MRRVLIVFGIMIIGLATLGHPGSAAAAGQHQVDTAAVSVEIVADYIHSVIEAHRAFYTQAIERIQQSGKIVASENWRTTHMLPLPVQLLQGADNLGVLTGSKIRYRLIGLWPINKQNAPLTDFEKKGLDEVQKHPEQPYSGLVSKDEAPIFSSHLCRPCGQSSTHRVS